MTKRPSHQPQWATESGCLGKQLFTDLSLAREVATRTNRSRNAKVQPYRCARCDGWHVGNRTNSSR